MATFLLTWNPNKWSWDNFEEEYALVRAQGFFDTRWSCGVTRRIELDDRVFLLRQAVKPRGLIGSGFITKQPFEADHFSEPGRKAWYIEARMDVLLSPENEIFPRSQLETGGLETVHWDSQSSGVTIPDSAAAKLELRWDEHLASIGLNPVHSNEEVFSEEVFWEGAVRQISVNAYERNPRARAACIKTHGDECCICGFRFATVYGEQAAGFIHVHHLRLLSEIGQGYKVDPIADLRPVCPNCHAVIHRRTPPYSVEEVRQMVALGKK